MALFKTNPVGLEDFVRVENTSEFVSVFKQLYASQDEVLYNHSPIFPFAYLNLGRLQLFINKDHNRSIIPVVKKFDAKPSYEIHSPFCTVWELVEIIAKLDKVSSNPVIVTDLTKSEAEYWLRQLEGDTCTKVTNEKWKKVKTSDDIVQDAEALSKLAGRNYSSLRNTLKHVRNDLKPETKQLSPENKADALSVFNAWKEKQGKKYFRVTIGRDLRLIEEYADKLDFVDYFSYVHYVNGKPEACSFGCRSWKQKDFGIDITVKANVDCKGLGDYAFVHLMTEMNKQGIKLVNDSGGTGNVKLNKQKFRPVYTIPMYNLVR